MDNIILRDRCHVPSAVTSAGWRGVAACSAEGTALWARGPQRIQGCPWVRGGPLCRCSAQGQYDDLPSSSEQEAGGVCFPAGFVTMSPIVWQFQMDFCVSELLALAIHVDVDAAPFVVCRNTQHQHTLETHTGKLTAASPL